ncbi:MAG: TIGR00159 family protein [Bryobacterales bacterium]|nr:TIGR00159 family protein [Bryobacterales bacterium]
MQTLFAPILYSLPKLTIIAFVDIILTAALIYQFLIITKGRRAAHVLAGISTLVIAYIGALIANLEMLRTILATMAPYTAVALIVMFQVEIRRALARIGRRGWFGFGSRLKRREFVEEILLAMEQLSRTKTGALIVLERDIGLRTFIESGVSLDSVVSRDLLLAIFHPGGALHDGAVIIQNERIAAAACFLPLSMNPTLMSKLGTRHRAAIGISEDTDSLALVVSEETGTISAAVLGEIKRELTLAQLDEIIAVHMGAKTRGPEAEIEADDIEPAVEEHASEVNFPTVKRS